MSVHPKDAALAAQYVADMDEIQALQNLVATLQNELETLRLDKARLDWLEIQEYRQMVENDNITDFLVWYPPWLKTAWGKTYREAIDAAMAIKPGE